MDLVRREEIILEYLNNIATTTLENAINKIVINHQQIHRHLKDIRDSKKKNTNKRLQWKMEEKPSHKTYILKQE